MKPGVPWSVKGIEPDARAAAKVAARQAGMTLGQWLNQVILDAGADDNGNDNSPSNVDDITAYRLKKKHPADQEISELHAALAEMADLFRAAEEQKTATLDEIDQTLSTMAERIDHVEHDEASESLSALQNLQKAQSEILVRLEKIEQTATSDAAPSSALSGALANVMAHLETSERQSVGGMQAVERAITRLVDRMDAIEQDKNTSAELIGTALQHMHARMEDRESQYRDDQQALTARLETIQDRISKLENRASENRALKDNLTGLIQSIEAANQKSAAVQTDQLLTSALQRLETLEAQLSDAAVPPSTVLDPPAPAAPVTPVKDEPAAANETPPVKDASPVKTDTPKGEDAPVLRKTKRPAEQPSTGKMVIPGGIPSAIPGGSDEDDAGETLLSKTMRRAGDIISKDFVALLRSPKQDDDTPPESARFIRTNIFDNEAEEDDETPLTRSWLIAIILGAFGIMAIAAAMLLSDDMTGAADKPQSIERQPVVGETEGGPATLATDSAPDSAPVDDSGETPVFNTDVTDTAEAAARAVNEAAVESGDRMALSAANYSDLDTLSAGAEAGDINAAYLLGLRYYNGDGVKKNDALAASYFAAAANQGLAPAQYRYALHLERGLGVQRSPAKALGWYEAAAILGHRKAMYNLAVLYANGAGTEQDLSLARQWFEEAAQYDLQDAKYNLGILYLQGKGGNQDMIQAYQWFTLAAQNGDQDAANQAKQIEAKLAPTELGTARARATNWSPRALDPYVNFDTPSLN